jgi:molybdate transport system substrate-binding protein
VSVRRVARIAVGALVSVTLAACATSQASSSSGGTDRVTLTVLGAASLTDVFPKIGAEFTKTHPGVTLRFSFAGTDALAAQIEQRVPADVFAGASTRYGDQLSAEGLVIAPTVFCTNTLVLVLPAGNPAGITSLADLTRPGIKLVIAAESVPVGAYTRKVLANLDATYGADYATKVLANVVSDEDSVESVLAKVKLGEADAGFVYVTDARAAGSQVTTIIPPADAQAVASYPIATVKASPNAASAQRFVDFVLSPNGQAILRAAGFGPPPAG